MKSEPRIIQNTQEDQRWADLLSPLRRTFIAGAGLTAVGALAGNVLAVRDDPASSDGLSFRHCSGDA